jgi:hypothetical protein
MISWVRRGLRNNILCSKGDATQKTVLFMFVVVRNSNSNRIYANSNNV